MTQNRSFYFSDGPYIQVLKALVEALTLPEAFVKLLGNPLTGKSVLCTKLTQYLRCKGLKVIYFGKAIESPGMLRAALAQEFDLPLSANFAGILEDALHEQNQKRVILIFDDAHLLTNITLIEIYRLAEVQVNKKRLLNVLLCGEPGLEKRLLSNSEFKSLLLNVSHKFKLEPMNEEELAQSFYRFVEMAGLPGLQLEPSAIGYFFKLCKGFPGSAANMCQLIVAARKNSSELHPISKTELVEIFSAANGEQALPTVGFRYTNSKMNTLISIAAVMLVVSVGLIYRLLNQPGDGLFPAPVVQGLVANSVGTDLLFQSAQEAEAIQTAGSRTAAGTRNAVAISEVTALALQTDEFSAEVADSVRTGRPEIEPESNPAASGTIATVIAVGASSVQGALSETTVTETTVTEASDSGLVLVTAKERGIDLASIAEPAIYGTLQAQTAENIGESAEQQSTEESTGESSLAVVEERLDESEGTASSVSGLEQEAAAVDEAIVAAAAEQPAQAKIQIETVQPAALQDEVVEVDSGVAELAVVKLAAAPQSTIAAPALVAGSNEPSVETDASSNFDLGVLEQFIAAWVDAWQAQSLGAYFSAYHAEFEPRYQDSVSAWRSSRERVIDNAGWIELELSDFQYIGEEAGVIEVHFWLNYRSPTYQDDTQKKLLLGREAGEWRILEEINLQVRR
jgi:type II secretory pathway predicted ATPase ExeA